MKRGTSLNWLTRPWQWFAVDARSVEFFRICLGLVLLFDLLVRIPDAEAFFSDFGVYPRSAVPSSWYSSLYLMSGSIVFVYVLLAIQIALAIGVVIGWKTRWTVFLSWILLMSLQNRNFLILNSGDTLFRNLFFWSLFIPLGTTWSVDQWLGEKRTSWANFKYRNQIISAGAIAVMAQLVMMYAFSARLKTGVEWVETHTAVEQALRFDQYTLEPGYWLLNYPALLKTLTWATIILEKWGWLILFTPVFFGPVRFLAVLIFVGFHAGLWSTMSLGNFQLFCMAGWMLLLPSWFWDTLLPWCGKPFRFAVTAKTKIKAGIESIATRLWGAKQTRQVSSGPTQSWHLTAGGAIICLLLLHSTFLYNLRQDPEYSKMYKDPAFQSAKFWPLYLSHKLDIPIRLLRIRQKWNMFAPRPPTRDGWYVIVGETVAGATVEVLRHPREVDWSKPERVQKTFPNERWRKYLASILRKPNVRHRVLYANYLNRKWKREHPEKDWLKKLTICYVIEQTLPDGQEATPTPRKVLVHDCLKQ